jgi:hypothetical protein
MKKVVWWGALALVAALVAGSGVPARAEGFEVVKGKAFDTGFVRDFYLEGNSIPTQKRNAAMIKAADGKRMVFALLDTSGYGADVQAKYVAMAIVEKKASLGGTAVGAGAYGLGLEKATRPGEKPAKLHVYDVGGQKVGEATAQYDAKLAQPVPLQVVTEGGKAKLYLGRYWVEIQ